MKKKLPAKIELSCEACIKYGAEILKITRQPKTYYPNTKNSFFQRINALEEGLYNNCEV